MYPVCRIIGKPVLRRKQGEQNSGLDRFADEDFPALARQVTPVRYSANVQTNGIFVQVFTFVFLQGNQVIFIVPEVACV